MSQVKTLIEAFPDFKKECEAGKDYLFVSEFYYDTIQGEGIHIGAPAAFLRLQGCVLNCDYCDTAEVWRVGNPYCFCELFDLMDRSDIIPKLIHGQHLVITGGSPLRQQEKLTQFLSEFLDNYKFLPFIEIENECVIHPNDKLIGMVACWNNSPKLSTSLVNVHHRYNIVVIGYMASLPNSWFKFVVGSPDDWQEIEHYFLDPGLIAKSQVILMPEGATRAELAKRIDMVVDMAVSNNVRFSTREHIVLWDKKIGV